MRLDKFLSNTAAATRSEAGRAARRGEILVNGKAVTDASVRIDENADTVVFRGEEIKYKKFIYIMLNKPAGYISATDDPKSATVLDLLPENIGRLGLFPCGRLDVDTTGLLILTNDGQLAHRLLAPKFHVAKTYAFSCSPPLGDDGVKHLCEGVDIGEKAMTKPAELSLYSDRASGMITISEGKFHQIKRMFFSVGSQITSLSRVTFAGLPLDGSLSEGEWRYLTEDEENRLKIAGNI